MEQSTSQHINMPVYCAPVQGLTETAWRHFHRDIYGDGITSYFNRFCVSRGERCAIAMPATLSQTSMWDCH